MWLCFYIGQLVRLFVCPLDISEDYERRILMNFGGSRRSTRNSRWDFGGDPGSRSDHDDPDPAFLDLDRDPDHDNPDHDRIMMIRIQGSGIQSVIRV